MEFSHSPIDPELMKLLFGEAIPTHSIEALTPIPWKWWQWQRWLRRPKRIHRTCFPNVELVHVTEDEAGLTAEFKVVQ